LGHEIIITALSGKWKISQNQPEHNRAGVIQGLRGTPETTAMAELIKANARSAA
jgi:transcriptional regulator